MAIPSYLTCRLARIACWAPLVVTMTFAHAQKADPYLGRNEWNPVDVEVQQLPPYCQADLRPGWVKSPGTAAYGCTFINHFCPALVALNRAMNPSLPMGQRKYMLQQADDHLRYTRTHMAASCKLIEDVQGAEMRARMLRSLVK
ncbi:MAG: hypothetical protein MUF16_27140 [Burkholderiaceae bacterium]|nr:hypothetical protein [Burkholderiaceae bacterium]